MALRTNVTRLLDARKVAYEPVEYDPAGFHSAAEVAALVGVPPGQVFKTIVVLREGRGRRPLLVIVPADREVDLKRLAAALGEKKLRVAPQREAESLTKLQVGGISALALIGKGFDVVLDRTADAYAADGIYVSAGQRGLNVRLMPSDLVSLTGARLLDASTEES
jgi:Cys-tRNA(Pro)/Cys-tRNA(Cys) deacylase